MAHELTIREDGFVEMAFVGKTPWHKLGQSLDQNADMETWRKAAGMDWMIHKAQASYSMPDGSINKVKDRYVQYRSDNGEALSIVSARYKPVQPHQVLDFFKLLADEAGFKLHTAGTLFGGRRMWALAETGKYAEVNKDDGVGAFLLLSTSCDKSLATTARFTTVRVVCNNTLSYATNKGESVSFTHLSEFDPVKMRDKLMCAVQTFGSFMEMSKHLSKQRMMQSEAKDFVKRLLFTKTELESVNFDPESSRAYGKIIGLFNGQAKGSELVGDSKWGLLNAVTEYFDHHHPARDDSARLNNSWFGHGNKIKAKAIELLTA